MRKVKILAVAPYEGLADMIREIAADREDAQITVRTGDLLAGRQIAEETAHKHYDVIISRGGTAEMIRAAVETPVVDIPISGYDILRAVRLAESCSGRFAIAGFPGITRDAATLCDLLQYSIDIITFTDETDAAAALKEACERGITLVLCDMAGCSAAKKLGLNAILISSGAESIESALNEAVRLTRCSLYVRRQNDLFLRLMSEEDQSVLIYDPSKHLWFSSLPSNALSGPIMDLAKSCLSAFAEIPGKTVARQLRGRICTLTGLSLPLDGQTYTAIAVRLARAPLPPEDPAFRIFNRPEQAEGGDLSNLSVCSGAGQTGGISRIIAEYSKSRLPVLIIGETGTGKDRAAGRLYQDGPFCRAPLYIIDCASAAGEKLESILEGGASPLPLTGVTIYFKHPSALPDTQLEWLLTRLERSDAAHQNRLLFSLTVGEEDVSRTEGVRELLENRFSCLTLRMVPLRERRADLSGICALRLHKINMSMGRQIIGFEDDAMKLMEEFSWPRNLDQLFRVLKELAAITRSPYITGRDVRRILNQERLLSPPSSGCLDLSQTLDEINYQIIRIVLEEENGNKEQTAKRLGISRSTLWRILKNHR